MEWTQTPPTEAGCYWTWMDTYEMPYLRQVCYRADGALLVYDMGNRGSWPLYDFPSDMWWYRQDPPEPPVKESKE